MDKLDLISTSCISAAHFPKESFTNFVYLAHSAKRQVLLLIQLDPLSVWVNNLSSQFILYFKLYWWKYFLHVMAGKTNWVDDFFVKTFHC